MTDKEIMVAAMKKARNNGWTCGWYSPGQGSPYSVIFNHGFAKAFWGEGEKELWTQSNSIDSTTPMEDKTVFYGEAWEYHLQQIALVEDSIKIKYLEPFL